MIRLEIEFKTFDELQEFLNPRISGLGVPAYGTSVVSTPEAKAAQKEKNKEVTEAVEKVAEKTPDGAVDFIAVKGAILELSKAKGRDVALAVLAKFNDKNGKPCEKVTAIAESDYPAVLTAVKEAM